MPAAPAFPEPRPSDVTWTHIIYALHAIGVSLGVATSAFVVTSFLFGLPSIVAVIMNYIKRSDVRGTFLDSHFRWQIRTFWYALLWIAVASLVSIPLMLVLRDALPQPLLYLSAYFEQHRSEYYDHLLITSQSGDLMPWIAFFLRGVRQQARDSEERTVRLVELQHQLRDELLDEGRPNSVIRLAEQLFASPVVTAARVEASIGVTRPTAHAAIDALVERGDLVEVTGRERRRIYEAPRIFEAVYGSVDVDDE